MVPPKEAARLSEFSPTLLKGKPVKVIGLIVFTFGSPTAEQLEDRPLRIISKPLPTYIENARTKGINGTVQLRVQFSATGEIGTITIVKSLDHELDALAEAAARGIKFEPALRKGVPITTVKTIEYSFAIY